MREGDHLGKLLRGAQAAFGDPLMETATYRDRTLDQIPRLLGEEEVPLSIPREKREEIFSLIDRAIETAAPQAKSKPIANLSRLAMMD